ncbi:hypothetical protein HLB44_20865 [Aquincola sp. S2]|uniref:NarX-like N-terminal domain-containing protein n=1 Tax=Pseudaquabacterium terrae TaxID=2732868 RepID=A0ABX2ELL5_9BURK|nr:hypothetical protein [Aquabacterium terrae]NRF69457.1 hypothetical protein [Aquabacterium terrae]
MGAIGALALGSAIAAPVRAGDASVLAAAELRVGVERLAKLRLELAALSDTARARDELGRERSRVIGALETLRGDTTLSTRRRGQVQRLSDGVTAFVERVDGGPQAAGASWPEVYRDSEALAAQMSFVSTGLSGEMSDGSRATLVDLLTRAAATALRVGKLNFAAAAGPGSQAIAVDVRQAMGEFTAALEAISGSSLHDQRMHDELALARNQWVMFSAALNEGGLVKERRRLNDVATTADRIAQSLLAMAQRAMRPPVPTELAARRG